MKVNTNIAGWLRLLLFASGAVYLWRSALVPRKDEPRNPFDRALRLIGAVMLTGVVIYFVGFGFGFWSLK